MRRRNHERAKGGVVHARTGAGWECAEWDGRQWYIAGSVYPYRDADFVKLGARIPTPDEPFACVPQEITADSGHKAGIMGDFHEAVSMACTECDSDDPDPDCEVCGGLVEFEGRVPISWTTIKAIHRRIVEIATASKPGGE